MNNLNWFEWLENTPVATWVGESLWAYPFWLSLHAVGLATVVGIFIMRDLKLLGMFDGIEAVAFLPLIKFAWIGFVVNAISGLFLFTSQASMFIASTPFLIKILSIVIAALLAAITQSKLRAVLAARTPYQPTIAVKSIAVISIFLWISAIVSGRLIAYL